jgi:hypothetical protein
LVHSILAMPAPSSLEVRIRDNDGRLRTEYGVQRFRSDGNSHVVVPTTKVFIVTVRLALGFTWYSADAFTERAERLRSRIERKDSDDEMKV